MLSDSHLKILEEGSSIKRELIEARGYRSITNKKELLDYGFSEEDIRYMPSKGILMPIWKTDGANGLYQYRPDKPKKDNNGKERKYLLPKGSKMVLDVPRICSQKIKDPSIPLIVTEGIKKGDSLASLGACVISLLGVWNFTGKNDKDGLSILPDWKEVALNGREVIVVYDSDVMVKKGVQLALREFTKWLGWKKANVSLIYLPTEGEEKIGIDDYIRIYNPSLEDLLNMAEEASFSPSPPQYKLLDKFPDKITKPIQLINGKAYVSTWLPIEKTISETVNDKGEVVNLNPPEITVSQELYIFHEGKMYGEGRESLYDLDIENELEHIPHGSKLWSPLGVRNYLQGKKIDPALLFNQVKENIDFFVDFDRSLATQSTMAELIACYIFTTWFMESFNVTGFIWPNGNLGSGKTQSLNLISNMSYLGQVILAASSVPVLREYASYGATLCFDDCEAITNPKSTDPDKRDYLLSGNRRGTLLPVNVQNEKGKWEIEEKEIFCPKAFTAINLPDPILASRSIIIPLIRTNDKEKANRDPLKYSIWKHKRREIVDSFWQCSLEYLPELQDYDSQIEEDSEILGRALEPWKAILSIAKWLDDKGVKGLYKRITLLSKNYQTEKLEIGKKDLPTLIVEALQQIWVIKIQTGGIEDSEEGKGFIITSNEIQKVIINDISESDEDEEENYKWLSTGKIGKALSKLRFKTLPRSGGKGSRPWLIPLSDLQNTVKSYGIDLDKSVEEYLATNYDLTL